MEMKKYSFSKRKARCLHSCPVPGIIDRKRRCDVNKYDILKQYYGYDDFREGQADVIDSILAGRDVLGVMPTGAGKSVCYQVPAMLLPGITLVISPLISLMKDQVLTLVKAGYPAAYINSSLTYPQYLEVLRRLEMGRYKLVYLAPERLAAPGFRELAVRLDISFLAVDEAHCISQWGQDFRPDYLRIEEFVSSLPHRPVMGAFTATATRRVKEDIRSSLKLRQPFEITTGFNRPNLYFGVRSGGGLRDVHLLEEIERHQGRPGIVYCATRKNVEKVCALLQERGYAAAMYPAGLEPEQRSRSQEDFLFDRAAIMVATNAFGMGIDKADVGYVIHYNMPKSIEAYYQEAGRAGRDGEKADCILLYSAQDVYTQRFLIENAEPNPALSEEEQQEARERDYERLWKMRDYAENRGCLRAAILRYFGERTSGGCGNCSNCRKAQEAPTPLPRPGQRARPDEQDQEKLFLRLRNLRTQIAREENVPAYMILPDATLREIGRRQPKNTEELLRVPGIGKVKAEKYGRRLLAALRGEEATRPIEPPKKQAELPLWAYREGTAVIHKRFGRGVIRKRAGDVVAIAFASGEKTLALGVSVRNCLLELDGKANVKNLTGTPDGL